MHLVSGFQLRKIGAEQIAVPTGAAAVRFNGLISLNETGAFLFQALLQPISKEALFEALCQTYNAPEELLRSDMERFLAHMRELSLLEEEPNEA